MRKTYHLILIAVATGALVLPTGALAQSVEPTIDFGIGYAVENGRVAGDQTSTPGDILTIAGPVVRFDPPFDDLDPNNHVFVYSGLISLGTIVTGAGPFFYQTDYVGGTLRVYEDMAWDFCDLGSFMDGTLILQAQINSFTITTNSLSPGGNMTGSFQYVGGTLFDRVSDGGTGFSGVINGAWTVDPSLVEFQECGYFGEGDSDIKTEIPLPTEAATWGQIKQFYR